jgi:hypothetical protein
MMISGDTLFTGNVQGTVLRWDIRTKTILRFYTAHESEIRSFLDYGEKFFSASEDGLIIYWAKNGAEITRVLQKAPSFVDISLGDGMLYIVYESLPIIKWDMAKMEIVGKIFGVEDDTLRRNSTVAAVFCLGFLFTADSGGSMTQWNVDQNWPEDILLSEPLGDILSIHCTDKSVVYVGSKSAATFYPTEFPERIPAQQLVVTTRTTTTVILTQRTTTNRLAGQSSNPNQQTDYSAAAAIIATMLILVTMGMSMIYISFKKQLDPVMDLNYTHLEEAKKKEKQKEEDTVKRKKIEAEKEEKAEKARHSRPISEKRRSTGTKSHARPGSPKRAR